MKSHHQLNVAKAHVVGVRGAPFGALGGYMEFEPGNLHAKQSSALFKVDVPQSMAMGRPLTQSIFGVAWADAKTPVAVLGHCVGKVYIAAAFNLLDPSTRERLEEARLSGKFTAVIEFNSNAPGKPKSNFDSALIGIPAETFDEALQMTGGLKATSAKAWGDIAAPTMLEWLASKGLDGIALEHLHFSAFCVVPVEADGGLCAGWE